MTRMRAFQDGLSQIEFVLCNFLMTLMRQQRCRVI